MVDNKAIETKSKIYDLEDRTSKFSELLVEMCIKYKKDIVTTPLISQLVRSGTSIGANYCEANGASSKKDFANKIFICKKECKETQYWLNLLIKTSPNTNDECCKLKQEAKELTLIFSAIASRSK